MPADAKARIINTKSGTDERYIAVAEAADALTAGGSRVKVRKV